MDVTKFKVCLFLVFLYCSGILQPNYIYGFQSILQSNYDFQIEDESNIYIVEFSNLYDSIKMHFAFVQYYENDKSIIEFMRLEEQFVDSIQDPINVDFNISSAYVPDTLSGYLTPSNTIASPFGSFIPIPSINVESPLGDYSPIPYTSGNSLSDIVIEYTYFNDDVYTPSLVDPESSGLGVIFIIEEPLEFEIVINSLSSLDDNSPGFIIVKEDDDIKIESTHSIVFSAGFEFTSESNLDILIELSY